MFCNWTKSVTSCYYYYYYYYYCYYLVSEAEIIYLESNYNKLRTTSTSGRFDLELFRRLVSPPLPRQLTGSKFLV